MVCFNPITAYKPSDGGKLVFTLDSIKEKRSLASNVFYSKIQVPCNGCIGCRLEYSRQWAVRCMHEASLYTRNCFLTLTYSNDTIPSDYSLRKKDFQDFMKRFRERCSGHSAVIHPKSGKIVYPIRSYHCGEYGEQTSRPHYHACIFNFDFDDKKFLKMSNNFPVYTSDLLDELWSFGHCYIGTLTFQSAAYVARYIMKKQKGKGSGSVKAWDSVTGEVFDSRQPEFVDMSRAWGIGYGWYSQFKDDCYPDDFIIVNKKKTRIPRYYDKLLQLHDPTTFDSIKELRRLNSEVHSDNNTPERLAVRETLQLAKLERLYREFE